MDFIWLIPILPGVGAALNGVFGIRFFSKRNAGALACATMAGAFLLSVVAFVQLLGLPADARAHDVTLFTWIPPIALQTAHGIGIFQIPWTFRLDPLAALMILVVTGVGLLIHIYSIGYMADEPRGAYARYFSYLNLFCFFMLTLVLGANLLVMFVGWEGVGLCSYLLIGYWYEKKSASDAGKKAFIVNRIGDWGFLMGVFLIFFTFGTLDFRAVANAAAAMPVETARFGTLSVICLLLFIGATGKSAQIPLYVWLPDAMEGPTPVSALIHAATMVTAGVYMVGRNAVLFSHAPMTMEIVAIVGVLTALMAASIGLVQNDIKRVLAYSTVSQLGYMFVAMGVGAYAAGAFHLMTHAFFKALLFLCSGAVIHAMAGEQDMRKMGGLRKHLPVTYTTMLIGTLAIAGIPPLAGFFSKDEILLNAFLSNKFVWTLAAVTALMTAFYMFRLISMTFFGPYRGPAWETSGPQAVYEAAVHGVVHPADPFAHGKAAGDDHEISARPGRPCPHTERRRSWARPRGRGSWRSRPRAVARAPRSAAVDDGAADGAGSRCGARRVRRHSGGPRGQPRDRDLPRTELHGVARDGGDGRGSGFRLRRSFRGQGRPIPGPRRIVRRFRPSGRDACRCSRRTREARDLLVERDRPHGVLGTPRCARHLGGLALLCSPARISPSIWPRALPAPTVC